MDITELKETQEKLKKAKEQAEAANVLKDQFIQNMEHDLRTPSSGLVGLLTIMVDQVKDPEQHKMIKMLLEASEELLAMINSMVFFNKVNYGGFKIVSRSMDIRKATQDVIALERPTVVSKNLKLQVEIDEKVPDVMRGDEFRYKRILLNLLGNALKFTDEGEVSVKVDCFKLEEPSTIWIKIVVHDTGIGIPASKKAIIWEKFTRLHPSNQGIYKGTGLGLYVVKRFVTELGGEIQVTSQPTKGATFTCLLPFELSRLDEKPDEELTVEKINEMRMAEGREEARVEEPEEDGIEKETEIIAPSLTKKSEEKTTEAPQITTEQPKTPSKAKKGSILVVEDSPIAQRIGQMVLTNLGYEVTIAPTGKAGFKKMLLRKLVLRKRSSLGHLT